MKTTLVKPFVAILTSATDLLGEVVSLLEKHFGRADAIGQWHAFDCTSYYEPEMGRDLKRCLVSFDRLVTPDSLAEFKNITRDVEKRFCVEGKRRINIDPGYVDHFKVVLVSGKGGGHMLMMADGIWADLLLWYNKSWQTLPWSYPDFRDGTYFAELMEIRSLLKKQISHQATDPSA